MVRPPPLSAPSPVRFDPPRCVLSPLRAESRKTHDGGGVEFINEPHDRHTHAAKYCLPDTRYVFNKRPTDRDEEVDQASLLGVLNVVFGKGSFTREVADDATTTVVGTESLSASSHGYSPGRYSSSTRQPVGTPVTNCGISADTIVGTTGGPSNGRRRPPTYEPSQPARGRVCMCRHRRGLDRYEQGGGGKKDARVRGLNKSTTHMLHGGSKSSHCYSYNSTTTYCTLRTTYIRDDGLDYSQ